MFLVVAVLNKSIPTPSAFWKILGEVWSHVFLYSTKLSVHLLPTLMFWCGDGGETAQQTHGETPAIGSSSIFYSHLYHSKLTTKQHCPKGLCGRSWYLCCCLSIQFASTASLSYRSSDEDLGGHHSYVNDKDLVVIVSYTVPFSFVVGCLWLFYVSYSLRPKTSVF